MSEIAKTIYAQLGGRKFQAMTGARDFVAGGFDLAFKFPKSKGGINCARIELSPDDRYTVIFYRLWGAKCTVVAKFDGIYCDGLEDLFERVTGLRTRLF